MDGSYDGFNESSSYTISVTCEQNSDQSYENSSDMCNEEAQNEQRTFPTQDSFTSSRTPFSVLMYNDNIQVLTSTEKLRRQTACKTRFGVQFCELQEEWNCGGEYSCSKVWRAMKRHVSIVTPNDITVFLQDALTNTSTQSSGKRVRETTVAIDSFISRIHLFL
jgi:hypothetical protein